MLFAITEYSSIAIRFNLLCGHHTRNILATFFPHWMYCLHCTYNAINTRFRLWSAFSYRETYIHIYT